MKGWYVHPSPVLQDRIPVEEIYERPSYDGEPAIVLALRREPLSPKENLRDRDDKPT